MPGPTHRIRWAVSIVFAGQRDAASLDAGPHAPALAIVAALSMGRRCDEETQPRYEHGDEGPPSGHLVLMVTEPPSIASRRAYEKTDIPS